jgi:hypothetical protein
VFAVWLVLIGMGAAGLVHCQAHGQSQTPTDWKLAVGLEAVGRPMRILDETFVSEAACEAAAKEITACAREQQLEVRAQCFWGGRPPVLWLAVRSCRCRPASRDNGLPIGCILSARPGSDMEMCGWARQLVGPVPTRDRAVSSAAGVGDPLGYLAQNSTKA